MKRKLSIILVAIFAVAISMNSCKPKQQVVAEKYDYEATSGGNQGVEGTTLLKITGKGKNADLAIADAKINAIHALLFRGVAGTNMTKPIITKANAETENADYFNKFFAPSGKHLQYLTVSGDGVQEKVKISTGYKVTMLISVKHAALRKQMEDDGMARKLNEGF